MPPDISTLDTAAARQVGVDRRARVEHQQALVPAVVGAAQRRVHGGLQAVARRRSRRVAPRAGARRRGRWRRTRRCRGAARHQSAILGRASDGSRGGAGRRGGRGVPRLHHQPAARPCTARRSSRLQGRRRLSRGRTTRSAVPPPPRPPSPRPARSASCRCRSMASYQARGGRPGPRPDPDHPPRAGRRRRPARSSPSSRPRRRWAARPRRTTTSPSWSMIGPAKGEPPVDEAGASASSIERLGLVRHDRPVRGLHERVVAGLQADAEVAVVLAARRSRRRSTVWTMSV